MSSIVKESLEYIKTNFSELMPKSSGGAHGHLYHYTTLPSAARFLMRSCDLYCTRYSDLNDDSEFIYGLEVICKEYFAETDSFDCLRERIGTLGREATLYSFSFTTEKDSLYQWVAYTDRKEGGVALGFDFDNLVDKIDARMSCNSDLASSIMLLLPCFYGEGEDSKQFIDFVVSVLQKGILKMMDIDPSWHNKVNVYEKKGYALVRAMLVAASLIKHHGFKDEKEWRLIFLPSQTDLKIGSDMFGGKLRIGTRLFNNNYPIRNYIDEIITSYHGNVFNLIDRICEILEIKNGKRVAIVKSEIPYNGR